MIHAYYSTVVAEPLDCPICLQPLTSQVVGHIAITAEEKSELPARIDRVYQFLADGMIDLLDCLPEVHKEVENDEVVIPIEQVPLHPVHKDCIAEWIKTKSTCPECRHIMLDLDTSPATIQAKIARRVTTKQSLIDVTKVATIGAMLIDTVEICVNQGTLSLFNFSRASQGIFLCTTALGIAAIWNAFRKTPWKGYPSLQAVATTGVVTLVATQALNAIIHLFR